MARRLTPFETFEHTADVGLVVRGHTLEELFANAADALVDLMVDPEGLREDVRMTATVTAADRPALLVTWLNELLYLLDVHRFLPRRCRITEFRDTTLIADLVGDTIDPNRHAVRRMVKAATYHGLSLTHLDGVWEARVIVDL
ncbi:MAG TPA: archease [bacterium]|nr:archease [bacterium]